LETTRFSQTLVLAPEDNKRLLNLCGRQDEHIRMIEDRLDVDIKQRGHTFSINGTQELVERACETLRELYLEAKKQPTLLPKQVHLYLQTFRTKSLSGAPVNQYKLGNVRTKRGGTINARGDNQTHYIQNISDHDISFGIGPAGTGKTYLAVACAVNALETERVSRIVLARPIVEAGEKLGFLPGDLAQKVHPYLRPLYDSLYEMMGAEQVVQLIERDIIELAPLAYMRGRSLNDSFIILDEAQNTTIEQMKMFLTRIGFNSKAVITGDVTQIDLPNRRDSGLVNALEVLKGVKGISFSQFVPTDIVRHPLVQSVVEAYERHANSKKQG
jgi:phosphate starvation-inducible PhoH-like protein